MRVLDLFSGIGGFSLGLERAGFKTSAFCEIDKKARQVLKKHWPNIPVYEDIRELTNEKLKADGIADIEVICGGFPCQDISVAGKGAGITGTRSGLWSEFARLIGEIRPQFAIVENVTALRSRGLGRVLGDLAKIGYDAEWHCIPASAVGAPHERDRLWIVAYPEGIRRKCRSMQTGNNTKAHEKGSSNSFKRPSQAFSYTNINRPEEWQGFAEYIEKELKAIKRGNKSLKQWWKVEPCVGRVADGIPRRMDRLKQLGNAVLPQIPEIIGRSIKKHYCNGGINGRK